MHFCKFLAKLGSRKSESHRNNRWWMVIPFCFVIAMIARLIELILYYLLLELLYITRCCFYKVGLSLCLIYCIVAPIAVTWYPAKAINKLTYQGAGKRPQPSWAFFCCPRSEGPGVLAKSFFMSLKMCLPAPTKYKYSDFGKWRIWRPYLSMLRKSVCHKNLQRNTSCHDEQVP